MKQLLGLLLEGPAPNHSPPSRSPTPAAMPPSVCPVPLYWSPQPRASLGFLLITIPSIKRGWVDVLALADTTTRENKNNLFAV